MSVWAVASGKGGSCKTTTVVNLSAALGEMHQRILCLDMDPQGSASKWFGVAPERGLEAVFDTNGTIGSLVRPTETAGVELVPASPYLVGVDKALASEPGAEGILRKALHRTRGQWDHVLIDCPPALNLLTLNAIVAADRVLIPTECSAMALDGVAALVRTLATLQERLSIKTELGGILASRWDSRTNISREVVEQLRKEFGARLFRSTIRESVRLREAPSYGQPVTQFAPRSAVASDFRTFAKEFLRRRKRQ